MARIIHRSKIYTKECLLTSFALGIMIGWGESLVIWMLLPFNLDAGDVILINISSGILGGLTAMLCTAIVFQIHRKLSKSDKFNRDIHQTSWAFTISMTLFCVIIFLWSSAHVGILLRILIFAILVFFLTVFFYNFSSRVLFRRDNAVRLTVEAIIVLYLLVYLFNHPGFSRQVPLSSSGKPNIIFLDSDNMQLDADLREDWLPDDLNSNVMFLENTYASVLSNHDNPVDLLSIYTVDSTYSLLDFLNYHSYHSGLFSVVSGYSEFPREKFQVADDQNYSMVTQLSLFKFFNTILGFVDLRETANVLDGFTKDGEKDPNHLVTRTIEYISQQRDENPFFLYIRYSDWRNIYSETEQKYKLSLDNLFSFLKYNGLLKNVIIVFTSSTGKQPQRPTYIVRNDWQYIIDNPFPVISQRDIPFSIAQEFSPREFTGRYCRTIDSVIKSDDPLCRKVLVFEHSFGGENTLNLAASGPYVVSVNKAGEMIYQSKYDSADYHHSSDDELVFNMLEKEFSKIHSLK